MVVLKTPFTVLIIHEGLAIASCVTAGGYAIGAVSGGSLNPAVSFGISSAQIINGGLFYNCLVYSGRPFKKGVAHQGCGASRVRQVHPGHVKKLQKCVRSAGPSGTDKKPSKMCSAGPSGTGKKPSKMCSTGPSGTSKKASKMFSAGPSGSFFLLRGGRQGQIFLLTGRLPSSPSSSRFAGWSDTKTVGY